MNSAVALPAVRVTSMVLMLPVVLALSVVKVTLPSATSYESQFCVSANDTVTSDWLVVNVTNVVVPDADSMSAGPPVTTITGVSVDASLRVWVTVSVATAVLSPSPAVTVTVPVLDAPVSL